MIRAIRRCTGLSAGMWCVILMGLLAGGKVQGATPEAASPRIDRTIDAGWKFMRGDIEGASAAATGASATDYPDTAWQTVDLPHSWNVADGASAKYYRGPAWYRLHLTVGPDLAGKRLFLRFGAASQAAEVFVNGQSAGVHKGGFSAFCFDVSSLLHAGDNVIAARVTNALDSSLSPLSGDFTVYGGLVREVHLLALDPVCISPIDDASPGVYLKTTVGATSADVQVTTKLLNGIKDRQAVTVTCAVLDAVGAMVGQTSIDQSIPASMGADAVGTITIQNPHLWNGRIDPYLYRVVVDVRRDNAVVDRVEQPLGFRTFKVDPNAGLILNGKPYDLHGADIHQGRPSVGWASTAAMIEQDYALVADVGCTGVRMAHYQHGDYEHTQCDKLGIIVWSELALVNKMTDTPAFKDNVKQQLREMIKQAGNHPSIFFWSMYNEPHVNAQEGTQAQWKLIDDLVTEAHQLDPSRLTTGAAADGTSGPILWYMDITGMNRYYGWYSGQLSDWGQKLSPLQTQFPGKSIGISEYGAGASVLQHETHPVRPTAKSNWHPEEWESLVHEAAWQAMENKPWIWCKFVWVMFDFGSAGRNEGDTPGINDKGLVASDHKTQKDVYFYYKANWTTEPMVHITDSRFNPRPAGACDVKVYSNCDSVELTLNGKSLGTKTSANHIFIWPAVVLADGQTEVRATGTSGGKTMTDTISWTASATMKEPDHTAVKPPGT